MDWPTLTPAELAGMAESAYGRPVKPVVLAARNLRRLLRTRFPQGNFKVTTSTSLNGDVATLKVAWPTTPGAPTREEVLPVALVFDSLAAMTAGAPSWVSRIQDRHGHANRVSLSPREPAPEEVAWAMARRLPPATPGRPHRM